MDAFKPVGKCPDSERMRRLEQKFREKFGGQKPEVVVQVPGRVNLIGEHIDYCGYGVHPMALERDILVLVAATDGGDVKVCNFDSSKYPEVLEIHDLQAGVQVQHKYKGSPVWWNYFLCGTKGILDELAKGGPGKRVKGFVALLEGRIPSSAGLSSSSALVIAGGICTIWANQVQMTRGALAELCAKSERFIGTQGGGMDQAIELLASEGTAKFIEFNPLKVTDVTLPEGTVFVIANSLVESNKADMCGGSQFNVRVAECRVAAKVIAKLSGVQNWEDMDKLKDVQDALKASLEQMVQKVREMLHEEPYSISEVCQLLGLSEAESLYELCSFGDQAKGCTAFELNRRASHVFGEAKRVYDFKAVCDESGGKDPKEAVKKLGKLMLESHQSCSTLYECSHPELDRLVKLSISAGAYGARLTGAGWGGCIVALVDEAAVERLRNLLAAKYYCDKLDASNDFSDVVFSTKPGKGAEIFTF